MTCKTKALRLLTGLAALALADAAAMGGFSFISATPAQAQFFEPRYPSLQRERGGGFFDGLFGGNRRQRQDDRQIYREAPAAAPVDSSRAPAPRKETRADVPEPTTSIMVFGDGMADWLGSGLEDAFADAPEIGIVRKAKLYSGLLRYDARTDQDWWNVARDLLANEKADYVVMMLGVGDRQNLRERDVAKEAEQQQAAKDQASKEQASTNAGDQAKKEADDEATIIAPEPKTPAGRRSTAAAAEFRSEPWEKIYTRRIDDTIAALRSKGVPVFWVGLPPIRGAKSTADTGYLNDLYRARAEKAGAVYVDVWDGFVDEDGKYTTFGPDYEGQMRRLRSGDGVYFTKYGARKLAHYVEREIRRYMANRGPIALPMGPAGPMPADGKSAVRPLAGPVVPLTTITGNNDELLGGSAARARADASATAVLVKGDAVQSAPGRADDFIWPPGSERPKVETPPVAAPVVAPTAAPTAAVTPTIMKPEPAPAAKPAEPKPVESRPAQAPAQVPAQAAVDPRPAPAAPPRAVERPQAPPQGAVQRPQQQPQQLRPQQQQQQRPQQQQQFVDPRAPRPPQGIVQRPPPRRDDGGLFGLFR